MLTPTVTMPAPEIAARRSGGQVTVIFALTMLAIVPLMALIFDGGNIYVQRRVAQNAADSASLAGTHALVNATVASQDPTVALAVCTYLTANVFGVPPTTPGTVGVVPSSASFVDSNGNALVPPAPITIVTKSDPTRPGRTIFDCGTAAKNDIPDGASSVHVDATIGPFPTVLAGFLGQGIASGAGAGIPQAYTSASASVQEQAVTAFDASNAPFIICGVNTALSTSWNNAPQTESILMPGKDPAEINPAMIGHTYIIHGASGGPNGPSGPTDCNMAAGIGSTNWQGLADQVANAGVKALPSNLNYQTGNHPNTIKAGIEGYKGCGAVVQASLNGCTILVPVALPWVPTPPAVPVPLYAGGLPAFNCVIWAAFMISAPSSNRHYATLEKGFSLGGAPQGGPWTFGTRNASPVNVAPHLSQ